MSGARAGSARTEHGPGVLVAALSSAFGVALIQGTGLLDAAAKADPVTGASDTVGALLRVTSVVFIGVAMYSGAVVTTNTFSVIVAGRVRQIALRRLLGSTARAERGAVAREGLLVGLIGAVIGLVLGSGGVAAIAAVARAAGVLADFPYSYANPTALLPAAAVVLTTWLAAVVGSRRVLTVTPMQALGGAEERSEEEGRASRLRSGAAVALLSFGALLLFGGVAIGAVDPLGLLVAFSGGIVSFTGVVLGAHLVIPRALRIVGRLMGGSATARLAAENAVRYPQRSTRSTVGLLVSVTLITTFAVALRTFGDMITIASGDDPVYYAGVDTMLTTVTVVFSVLIGFSAVIAGVGLVNALSLGVLQRTRELGLLRALGFSARQLRRMVLAESGQLVLTAVALGLLLGTVYGWAGAHSLIGAVRGAPALWFVGLPWPVLAVVVAGGVLLTLVASVAPARRATRIAPVEALGVE
ncbi:ABC transporter permease [Amnibacterium kyonggiense]|uniref:Putative ABC transport system permease protein n=1 Tax=Amnibacterium kyonggiense TaxID=595671 RepID=A0A4V3EBG7_9MICO|nr:ABC transporter permease [Amnibacterium kyonggiense]TDS80584.1 putative ABC transport system permease protein [Amnibacterium kyonggiense]